jgi:hypothetical protein
MAKQKLDGYSYHEALDRAYSVQVIIERMLIDHPVIKNKKRWAKKIEKAQELIAEVYIEIGLIDY